MKKSDIIAEYNRVEIYYQAMKALMKATGITPDTPTPEPTPEPTPTPTPEPTPTPTEPGIVYEGASEIFLKPGETTKIKVYFNGVSSTSDFVVIPNISSLAYNISAVRTKSGYKETINVKGISGCSGAFKMYIKTMPKSAIVIKVTVRG